MKHPNRSMPSRQQKSPLLNGERITCIVVFLISTLGLIAIVATSPKHDPTVYNPPSLSLTAAANTHAQVEHFKPKEKVQQQKFDVFGFREANEVLTFHIPDFHPLVKYELELGNNKVIKVKNSKVKYRYPKKGKYEVNLWVTYEGEKKLLESKELNIVEAIEVAAHAFYDIED